MNTLRRRCCLLHLEELLVGLEEGVAGGALAKVEHIVKALHAQVRPSGLQERIKLVGADLLVVAYAWGFQDLQVQSVPPGIRVLDNPRAAGRVQREDGKRGKIAKEFALDQGGAR